MVLDRACLPTIYLKSFSSILNRAESRDKDPRRYTKRSTDGPPCVYGNHRSTSRCSALPTANCRTTIIVSLTKNGMPSGSE